MYLVVIGVSALVLTLSEPLYRLLAGPAQTAAAVAAAILVPPAAGLLASRQVLRRLDQDPQHPARGQAAFGRGLTVIHGLLAAGHGGVMLGTDWLPMCAATPIIGRWPLVPGVLALLPFLTSVLLVWLAIYPADRAVRQIALELYLLRGKPLRPVWPRMQYLLYNLRHQVLFILIPMLLILAASDLATRYDDVLRRATGQPYAPDMLIGLAALGVAIVAPEMLRHIWVTQRLPDGPLRDRLLAVARKLRLRFREILIWRSGGMIVNAAVMGVIPPLRYVLVTDGMLEQMDDTKIEAVFGHEAGHVKRHHILFFLLFAFISGCAATVFTLRTHNLARQNETLFQVAATLFGAALLVQWGLLFGWVSRRFERQADAFGAHALALAGLPCSQPCALHTPAGNPGQTAARRALCSTAAHVFADALHEVALLNGIRPEARSWRHSSISSRSRFLQELALHPQRLRRFEAGVLATKAAILLAALVSGLWAAQELGIWDSLLRGFS